MFDSDGRLWIYDLRNGTGVEIGFTGIGSGDDPKFSPDGKSISFIRENSLSVFGCANRARRPWLWLPRPTRHSQRRSRLGLRRRAGDAQQLLLVAGLEGSRLSADGRDRCAAVSH